MVVEARLILALPRQLSLAKFKSLADGWADYRINQQKNSKLDFRVKNQGTIIHFNAISKTLLYFYVKVQYHVY